MDIFLINSAPWRYQRADAIRWKCLSLHTPCHFQPPLPTLLYSTLPHKRQGYLVISPHFLSETMSHTLRIYLCNAIFSSLVTATRREFVIWPRMITCYLRTWQWKPLNPCFYLCTYQCKHLDLHLAFSGKSEKMVNSREVIVKLCDMNWKTGVCFIDRRKHNLKKRLYVYKKNEP